ncbi:DNA polymerase epsilon subunit B [Camellia lanceoleosa]|uniref:DNA polymerase epsilon subunit B n=1 Tax=Camellia lanceoleosa TaxID=1840588 RepID=A0ACC0F393_9ERIC|nr:DNA polymerase epsilon subunit B [Camellia lanceoleosa]
MSGVIRKKVQRKFKMGGYTLKVEALNEVLSFLTHFQDVQDEALDLLLDQLQHQSLKSSILDKEPLHSVVSLLLEADGESPNSSNSNSSSSSSSPAALRIIDAFLIPKFRYDPVRKIFFEHTGKIPIHGDASAKATLYRDRFLLLLQRLSRDHFSKLAFDLERSRFGYREISPIQSLIGLTGRRWVMGVISQLEDGHFYLEDLTGAVEINLSNAKITTGFFSENTVVLAEGEMLLDGIFQVKTCGFPPLEDRDKSIAVFPGLDFFGGGTLAKEETLRLAEMEKRAVNDMFVILSDIWLDNEETMGKLETILDGYENVEVVPSLFVFMGNFCTHPCNLSFNSFSSLRLQFGKFGQMIGARQRLKEHSRFLLIPGPDDAGPSTVLPRCALPKYVTEEFQKHIPNAIFASNPCRVKFCTQEIVFFRQDLLYRMRRSCLMPPSTEETTDPFEHLVATVTHQSHLCPLPLTVQPIIWNYDHCLHLYPIPHTIVLGDKSEQKAFNYTGITCFNPGSFSNDSTFVAYRPCTREVELSAL